MSTTVGDVRMEVLSCIPKGVIANYDTSRLEFCNIVYMCIKDIDSSEYQVPDNIYSLVSSVISDIYKLSPSLYNDDWTKYCYLTIKKMYIQPNSYGNREGFHIDGFLSDQQNFIWSDCEATPTEVALGNFMLSDDHEKSLDEMTLQASNMIKQTLSTNVLYDMNQSCVHKPSNNRADKAVLRTFIKVTYSKDLFNCYGNAWNYKLPHIKPSTQRSDIRNHTVK